MKRFLLFLTGLLFIGNLITANADNYNFQWTSNYFKSISYTGTDPYTGSISLGNVTWTIETTTDSFTPGNPYFQIGSKNAIPNYVNLATEEFANKTIEKVEVTANKGGANSSFNLTIKVGSFEFPLSGNWSTGTTGTAINYSISPNVVGNNLVLAFSDGTGGGLGISKISITYSTPQTESAPTKITINPNGGPISTDTKIELSTDGYPTSTITYSLDNINYDNTYLSPFTLPEGNHELYVKATNGFGEPIVESASFTVSDNSQGGNDSSEQNTDIIDNAFTGIGNSTSYRNWTKSGKSGAEYNGNSAGSSGTVQLRSSDSSGIVTTVSGGQVSKINVIWNSKTVSGRTLDIYGMTTSYSTPSDLYNTNTRGTKIGSIVYGTSTELNISGDYSYVGLRSNDGAMYLDEIQITWLVESPSNVATPVISCEDNMVSITCETDGVTIYYTTDGTTPSSSSNKYEKPFSIDTTTTVKAVAINGNEEESNVATYTATYIGIYDSYKAFIETIPATNTQFKVNGDITLIYQNGQYLYGVDSQNYPMLLYGTLLPLQSNS